MAQIPCPHLGSLVELTDEREAHIAQKHGDLLPRHRARLTQTIGDPDTVVRSRRAPDSAILCRFFPELLGGKFVAAVVMNDTAANRYWVVTAFISRKLVSGVIEWRKN